MSLIAWYPLNGNLEDYSGNGNNLINNYTSVITENISGKIGKCYNNDASSFGYLTTSNNILLPQTHSMFCWIYVETLSTSSGLDGVLGNHAFTSFANTGITLKYVDATHYRVSLNTGNGTTRTYNAYYGDTLLSTQEWHHIGFTYDGSTIRLYVDGVLDKTQSYSGMYLTSKPLHLFDWSVSAHYREYTGYKRLNDVRIYDHCLSNKEVEELSKGLILHYTFDNPICPYENLWANNISFNVYNTYNQTASFTKLDEKFEGNDIYRLTFTVTDSSVLDHFRTTLSHHGIQTSQAIIYQVSEAKTFGILYRNITHADATAGGCAANRMAATSLPTTEYHNGWYRCGQTRLNNIGSVAQDYVCISFKCPSLQLNEQIIIDFCCPERYDGINFLPETDHYVTSPETTIYDASGHKHNGTINSGTDVPIFSTDHKQGSLSVKMPGTSTGAITTDTLFYDNTNQCHTVCAWVKSIESKSTQVLCNFNLGYRIEHSGQKALLYVNSNVNDCYVYSYSQLALNYWYHIAFVFDRNNNIMNFYLNGVLNHGYKTGTPSAITPNGINRPIIFGSQFSGYLDDIRVYATALNADDIKNIYESKCNIDNRANITSSQFTESSLVDTSNLIFNGKLELGNANGFDSGEHLVSYSNDSFRGSNGSLHCTESCFYLTLDNLIPINPNDTYQLDFDIKFGNISTTHYFTIEPYDQFKNFINFNKVNHYANTETTLAANLNIGDTTVTLTSSANWHDSSSQSYVRRIGICDLSYVSDYSKCSGDALYTSISGNVLTLQNAWTGRNIPAGTKVANFYDGAVYVYPASWTTSTAPTSWTHYTYTIRGNQIRAYTKYVNIGLRWAKSGDDCYVTNLVFKNITSPQRLSSNYKIDDNHISKTNSVICREFNEIGMPIRYIRDHCGISDQNKYAHWTEIEAYDSIGNNIALGKPAISHDSLNAKQVTDGKFDSYFGHDGTLSPVPYVTVDLQFVTDIKKVKIYHYFADNRIYQNTKTEVSSDGVTWYTIFNSQYEGTYVEQSTGKMTYIKPQVASLNHNGNIYCNSLNET